MSLTNICSCALIKDHKMRQIIYDLYPTILKNYEFGIIIWKNKYFDLFFIPPPALNGGGGH